MCDSRSCDFCVCLLYMNLLHLRSTPSPSPVRPGSTQSSQSHFSMDTYIYRFLQHPNLNTFYVFFCVQLMGLKPWDDAVYKTFWMPDFTSVYLIMYNWSMVCIYSFSARWCSVNCTQSTSQTLTVLFSYYELPAFFLFLSSYSSAKYGAMDLASYRSPAQSNFRPGMTRS